MPRARRLAIPTGDAALSLEQAPPPLPEVLHLGLAQVGPAWHQLPHRHDFHELGYIRRGRGSIEQDGARADVVASSIYWLPPGQAHGGETDERDPLQILYLSLRLPTAIAAILDRRLPRGAIPDQPGFTPLRHALRRLNEALVFSGPQAVLAARLLGVLANLVALADGPERSAGTPRRRALAEAALRRLDISVGSPPTLASVARSLHVGVDHLGDVLREHTDTTWPRLVAAARARRAQQLLADGRRPTREVARAIGLSGERALARLMRRETGLPPSAFRSD